MEHSVSLGKVKKKRKKKKENPEEKHIQRRKRPQQPGAGCPALRSPAAPGGVAARPLARGRLLREARAPAP